MEEIAYFTPKTKSGNAYWIDFWNADLFDGESHLSLLHQNDQIEFRADKSTWSGNFKTKNPNGLIQAYFNMPDADYFIGVIKVSSGNAWINIKVDDRNLGNFHINSDGVEIPITLNLSKGGHYITVQQVSFEPFLG